MGVPSYSSNNPTSQNAYSQGSGTSSTNSFIPVFMTRDPTPEDVNYPITKFWINTTLEQFWILWTYNKVNDILTAVWLPIGAGEGIQFIRGDDLNDVGPDVAGRINLLGKTVTNNGTIPQPVYTNKDAVANTEDITLQYSIALASANAAKVGLSNFLSTQFTVDPATGFVQLAGGVTPALLKVMVDAFTAPGTNPVVPNASGLMTIEGGATYATGTRNNPIRTDSLAANTIDLEIQLAGSNATTAATNKFGVSQFDANQFTVTSGYVQITNFSPFNYLQISSNYTVDTTSAPNNYLSCDSSGGAFTIKLLDAPTLLYRRFIIKDRTGNASSKNITITTVTGAVLIDGATSYIMAGNFDAIDLIWNGTSYEVY